MRNFRDFTSWRNATDFAVEIYRLTERFPASEKFGLSSQMQRAAVSVPVVVDGRRLATDLRIDLLVERRVVVELKSVLEMKDVFHLQLLSYLRLAKLRRGILVNFNTSDLRSSIWTKVNGYDVPAGTPPPQPQSFSSVGEPAP